MDVKDQRPSVSLNNARDLKVTILAGMTTQGRRSHTVFLKTGTQAQINCSAIKIKIINLGSAFIGDVFAP